MRNVQCYKTITLIQGSGYITEQSFLDKRIRVFGTPEDPLFLARDVAEWIEHKDVSTMMRNVDKEEKLTQTLFVSGQGREYWFLTEDGLYEVLMQSRKPKAKEFKKEVKKILKSIRKTGGYVVGQENMMQHRTYERHRSCTSFFYVRPSRGHFQLYRIITLYRKKLDSKNKQKNFESLKMKDTYTKRVKAAVYLYSYIDIVLIKIR